MALHHDFLEQAGHLAQREPNRPRQASLRRAVSTAYYALFHLLTSEGAHRLASGQPTLLRSRVRRAFEHREMKEVCKQFRGASTVDSTRPLLALPIEQHLRDVATAFVSLQEARHDADYDIAITFNRFDVLQQIDMARRAFTAWHVIRKQPNAAVFLAALLLQRHWK